MRIILVKENFLARLKAYYEITKPKTVWLLVFVGACAPLLSVKPGLEFWIRYALGIVFLTLSVAGTNAFTCWIDRDIDAVMERTKGRPLPKGQLTERAALLFSISTFLLGVFGALLVNPPSVAYLILGFIFSAVIYNGYLKRRSILNIVFASPAGMMPVLFMWSFVGERVSLLPVLFGLLVIFWTPAHIWSLAVFYRKDYEKASIPMLPVVVGETLAIRGIVLANFGLFATTLVLVIVGGFSFLFVVTALILNAFLFYLTIKAALKPKRKNAFALFKFSSPYLAIMFLLAVLDKLLISG